MDKIVPNGQKIRVFGTGNSLSGLIQFSLNKLRISGNNVGNGVLISDGKLHLKSGGTTASIIYSNLNPVGVTVDQTVNIVSDTPGVGAIQIINEAGIPVITSLSGWEISLKIANSGGSLTWLINCSDHPSVDYEYAPISSIAFSAPNLYLKYDDVNDYWGRLLRENWDGTLSYPITTSTIKLSSLTAKTGAGNSLLCIDSSGLVGTTASVSGDVPSTRTLGIAGAYNQIVLSAGNQDLSANRFGNIP